MAPPTVQIWDPLVRVLHWTLVAGVAGAWLTSEAGRAWHEPIGWVVLGAVAVRTVWGLIGPRPARFASFVRGPGATLRYLRALLQGHAPRHLGHNPLGGWMIVALLLALAGVGASGWLMTTDAFFGSEAAEEVHEALANGLLVLVGLHVAGVVFASWHQAENLVRAMWTGRKRSAAPGDVA